MKKMINVLIFIVMLASFLVGCSSNDGSQTQVNEKDKQQTESVKEDARIGDISENDDAEKELTNKVETDKNENPVVDNQQKASSTEGNSAKSTVKPEHEQGTNAKSDDEPTKKILTAVNQPLPPVEKPAVNSTPITDKPVATQKVEQEKNEQNKEEVSITIKADKETGVILKSTQVEFEQDDTVLDILKKVTKENKIQMEYRGSGSTAYIEGIQNIYEFDKGPKSGWMYSVNGVFMKKGAGSFKVKPGDKIEWLYTLDLGKDLGVNVNE